MRVRVKIEANDPSSYWLTCKAYAICNPGQPVYETTTALFVSRASPIKNFSIKSKAP